MLQDMIQRCISMRWEIAYRCYEVGIRDNGARRVKRGGVWKDFVEETVYIEIISNKDL